jgi:cytochrome P450
VPRPGRLTPRGRPGWGRANWVGRVAGGAVDPTRLGVGRTGSVGWRVALTDDLTSPATTRRHADLGGGIHYCLGAHLAKAELVEALIVMTRRMPNIRLAGPAPWKPVLGISGPIALPVEFDPGH